MGKLKYTIKGHGNPVVLLHGFCETKEIWESTGNALAKEFQVVCPDLPGFGESLFEDGDGSYSIDQMAETAYQLLEEIGLEKVVLIGHSMGGYVALSLAEKFPEKLAGLGLFHSTSYPDSLEKKDNRNQTVRFIQQHGGAKLASSLFPNLFSKTSKGAMPEKVEAFVQSAAKTPEATMILATEAMRDRPDRSHIMQQLTVPSLFIAGREDAAVPVEQTIKEAANARECTLHVIEEIGHMGMIEATTKTSIAVANFVRYCFQA